MSLMKSEKPSKQYSLLPLFWIPHKSLMVRPFAEDITYSGHRRNRVGMEQETTGRRYVIAYGEKKINCHI